MKLSRTERQTKKLLKAEQRYSRQLEATAYNEGLRLEKVTAELLKYVPQSDIDALLAADVEQKA